jgi:hypothetical protein
MTQGFRFRFNKDDWLVNSVRKQHEKNMFEQAERERQSAELDRRYQEAMSKWLNKQNQCVDDKKYRSYIYGHWVKKEMDSNVQETAERLESEYKQYKQYGNNYSTKVCYDWVKKKKDPNDITDLCNVEVL